MTPNFCMHRQGWGAHDPQVQLKDPERGSNLGFHIQYDVSECATDSDREEPRQSQAELTHKSNRSEQVVNPMSSCCVPLSTGGERRRVGVRGFRPPYRLYDSWRQ